MDVVDDSEVRSAGNLRLDREAGHTAAAAADTVVAAVRIAAEDMPVDLAVAAVDTIAGHTADYYRTAEGADTEELRSSEHYRTFSPVRTSPGT